MVESTQQISFPCLIFHWDKNYKCSRLELDASQTQVWCTDGSGSFKTVLSDSACFPGNCYFWELQLNQGNYFKIGVSRREVDLDLAFSDGANGWAYFKTGQLRHNSNGSGPTYGEAFGCGDSIGVYLDMINGTLSFSKNGKPFGVAYKTEEFQKGELYPAVAMLSSNDKCILKLPSPED